jgi:2,6-dihydroxypyridine 3-monooxygenase
VKDARVAVVGGSLGGLTAGLLVRDLGMDVTIHERSPAELQQRGAGIGFLPDSYRYLVERAGMALDDISTLTTRIQYLARDGAVTHDEPHSYRFSSWNMVYRSLLHCFGPDRYSLGSELTDFSCGDRGVHLEFAGGRTDEVDLLVLADGISSRFRPRLMPGVRPEYSGYVAWRGMTPEASLDPLTRKLLEDAITYFVYANSHILVYAIPGQDGSLAKGERLVNFVWYRNYLDNGDLADLLTDTSGVLRETSLPPGAVRADHAAELHAVARARLPSAIAEVVVTAPNPFLQVVYDVEVQRMAFGRACLVGDAAWVVRPHAAAGTAKAAADGWALAAALESHVDVEAALAAWEPGQMQLGRQLLDRTRRIGARSQFDGTWVPGDPELIFGLRAPGR